MEQELIDLNARIEELESRQAFQEDTLAQLNDVIAAQDASIRTLVARMRELGDKYRDLSFEVQGGQQGGNSGADEKPPHY